MIQNTKATKSSSRAAQNEIIGEITAQLDRISEEIKSLQNAIANFRSDEVDRFDELKRILLHAQF